MRERGDEDGRGIIAVAERSGIEPWRDQFYNEHSDTLELSTANDASTHQRS
jgi:hypothetical protein